MKIKCLILILIMLALIQVVSSMEECKKIAAPGEIPCLLISGWKHRLSCESYTASIYNENNTLLNTRTLGTYQPLQWCNITFNYTEKGTYTINFTDGDVAIITVQEDNNMLIAMVIGVVCIVGLFIILTLSTKDDKPFLANFFFIGIFIFTTVLSNLLWKMANVNHAPYEPIFLIIYRIMLIITMLMMFIILVLMTIDAVQIRRIKGNPIETYQDNLEK
jgi:hypothetical protein